MIKQKLLFLILQISSVGRLERTNTTPQLPRFQQPGEMNKPSPPPALFNIIAKIICMARSRSVQGTLADTFRALVQI